MALWPFRRKSDRKRSRSGAALSDLEGPPPRSQTEGAVARTATKKKQRTESGKLQRRPRTYSFSPGRHDNIRVDRERSPVDRARRRDPADRHEAGQIPWERTPTLHHARSGRDAGRNRSRRRKKKNEKAREAEIKAMSNFQPRRPATEAWQSGRPLEKETRRAKTTALGRQWDNPASDVSLPIPGSIHSSMSSDSDFASYKVSALDSLAPRPTLRYAQGTRWTSSRASVPAPTSSQRRVNLENAPIPEETLRAHKRIDDLADDLNASDLRELLERDQRRRDKQRQNDQVMMERRLARRAEKQRAAEEEARKSGTPPPENHDRGVMGREVVGLGIDPASAVRTSSKRRASKAADAESLTGQSLSKKPSDAFLDEDTPDVADQNPPKPSQDETFTPQETETEDPVPSLPEATKLAGLLRSKKSRSKSTLGSDRDKTLSSPPSRIDEEEETRPREAAGEGRSRFSLTSFLKRGTRSRRQSGPSSFSNTSREEMQAAVSSQAPPHAQTLGMTSSEAALVAQAQAHALARLEGLDRTPSSSPTQGGNYLSRKPSTNVPKRTRSRFREDLPDFPISPPDSRVQSPEAEPPLPVLPEVRSGELPPQPIPIPGSRRHNITSSNQPSNDSMNHASSDAAYAVPSPEPHQSMSLASIDSEGSWLSGRVGSRRASAMREATGRSSLRDPAHVSITTSSSTQEDLTIIDDEYLSSLAPHRNSSALPPGRRSGEGRPSSDEEDFADEANVRWGAVGARARMVHGHDRQTMQSHEGLLNIVSGDDASESTASSPSPAAEDQTEEQADLQRATSVNLGRGHARNFSAGSAKLLDLTPRSSIAETRIRSEERRKSLPLP